MQALPPTPDPSSNCCLYLAWLRSIQGGDFEDDTMEPAVPAGLGNLTAPLKRLADFLCVDPDLISAAAKQSENVQRPALPKQIAAWVAGLPPEDKNLLLASIIEDESPHVAEQVRRRALKEIRAGRQAGNGVQSGSRTAGQLLAHAEIIAEENRRIKAERAAQAKAKREREEAEHRKRHLQSLIGKEESLWGKVDQLIATMQAKGYDEAVSILQDLHDLAANDGTMSDFSLRMNNLAVKHGTKRAFKNRLDKTALLSSAEAGSRL